MEVVAQIAAIPSAILELIIYPAIYRIWKGRGGGETLIDRPFGILLDAAFSEVYRIDV